MAHVYHPGCLARPSFACRACSLAHAAYAAALVVSRAARKAARLAHREAARANPVRVAAAALAYAPEKEYVAMVARARRMARSEALREVEMYYRNNLY